MIQNRRKYFRKASQTVIAVRMDLHMRALEYRKWGALQRAKRGDWLVDNGGDIYTVDGAVFARTYRRLRPGIYLKTTPVWAEVALSAGYVKTKEGKSHYKRGDYLLYNNRSGTDAYCMSAAKFKSLYKPV